MLQDLADGLVRRRGLTKKDAELFVRTVFEIIPQYLETDKQVKIKGLGTFKIVQVNSRESVNVNTGERFRIDGHAKVTFVPDAVLKDEVNKPFLQFETVVINDSTPLSAMERMDVPEPLAEDEEEELESPMAPAGEASVAGGEAEQAEGEPAGEEREETPEEEGSVPVEPEAGGAEAEEAPFPEEVVPAPLTEDAPMPVEEDAPLTEDEEAAMPEGGEAPLPEGVEAALPEDEEAPLTESEEAAFAEEQPLSSTVEMQGQAQGEQPEGVVSGHVAEPVPAEDTPMSVEHLQVDYQRVESQRVEDLNVTSQRIEHQTIENQHIVQPEKSGEDKRGMRITAWGMMALFLLVILLMLGSYYAGYYGWLCPHCMMEQVMSSRNETKAKPQTPKAAVRKAAPAKADTVAVTPPETAARQAGTPPRDTIRKAPEAPVGTPAVKKQPAERRPEQKQPEQKQPEKPKEEAKAQPAPTRGEGQGYRQVSGGKYLIVGTRKTTQIRPGQTLRGIALEEYGSKGYASYIIVHNGIADPDKIEAGKTLKLPELKLRTQ